MKTQERPEEVERPETAPSGRLRTVARAFELGYEMSAPVRVGPQPAPGRFGGPSTSANGSAAVRCSALLWTRSTKKKLAPGGLLMEATVARPRATSGAIPEKENLHTPEAGDSIASRVCEI